MHSMLFINTSMQNMSLKTKFKSLIDNTPHPCLNPSTLDTNTSEYLRREHILDVFRTVQAAVLVKNLFNLRLVLCTLSVLGSSKLTISLSDIIIIIKVCGYS